MNFAAWNIWLLERFFGTAAAHQRVRLAVSERILDEAQGLGGHQGFLRAVRAGPDWPLFLKENGRLIRDLPQALLVRAQCIYAQWKYKGQRPPEYPTCADDAPPFLPYLALLCLGWLTEEEDLSANAYYKRLATIYPNAGIGTDEMKQLEKLWRGLQEWTKRLQGKRGHFKVESISAFCHVGVPLSQVILRASDLPRLHELFVDEGWTLDTQVSDGDLLEALLRSSHLPRLRRLLNGKADAEQRSIIVSRVREVFDAWDGVRRSTAHGGRSSGGASLPGGFAPQRQAIGLDRFVSLSWDGTRWAPSLLLKGAPCAGTLRLEAAPAGAAVELDEFGAGRLAAANSLELLGQRMQGTLTTPEREQLDVRLRARDDPWFSLIADGAALVEEPGCPVQGGYVLGRLTASVPDGAPLDPEPHDSVPAGWRLFYVREILPENFLGGPAANAAFRLPPLRLRTVGGTRIPERGYWLFDAPLVKAIEYPGSQVTCATAQLSQVPSAGAAAPGKAAAQVRLYRLLNANPGRHVVHLHDGAREVEQCVIDLSGESSTVVASGAALELDWLGRPAPGGAAGVLVPVSNHSHARFPDLKADLGERDLVNQNLQATSFRAVEALARWASCTYRELADWVYSQNLQKLPLPLHQEIFALACLGHLDIKLDGRGRWEQLVASQPCLYLLPATRERRYQAVLTGSYTPKVLNALVEAAAGKDIQLRSRKQRRYCLAPPRVVAASTNLVALEDMAKQAGLPYHEEPPCWQYAQWLRSLQEYASEVHQALVESALPDITRIYSREKFCFVTSPTIPPQTHGWVAAKSADPYVRRRAQPLLVEMRAKGLPRWAFTHNDRLAAWVAHTSLSSKGNSRTAVAYEPSGNCLVVPAGLALPLMHSRALVLASGIAPQWPEMYDGYSDSNLDECRFGHPAYRQKRVPLPTDKAYMDGCIRYVETPLDLASYVLGKLDTDVVTWSKQRPTVTIRRTGRRDSGVIRS